jgi:hypothetical protein
MRAVAVAVIVPDVTSAVEHELPLAA